MEDRIIKQVIEKEMKDSYIDYAMSVIVSRALPDVKDGLKPVHRRILFAMKELGLVHNKPYKKSARIVGETLGKFHPHGDTAVYDSLVRMAQNFSLRYPLVEGQGNFGSVDGDSAAAMRYTEARMSKLAEELLVDIEKETVDFTPNFDGSLKEPVVLPAKLPNLIINGSTGIAVGMATNIPPHNLNEVGKAIIYLIDNPDCEYFDLMQFIKGPDFPTAGIIMGEAGIKSAYKNGKGLVKIRARTKIEEHNNKTRIIITEIPYMVNKANLIESIANHVNDKKIVGISDIRDESDRKGMRVVIEVKRDANPEVVLNQLYKQTQMQTTFGINLLALYNNQPKVMTLKEVLQYYIEHRKDVIIRRTKYDLKKAEERAHILEGLTIALNNIDDVVQLIKKANNVASAKEKLVENYKLTDVQAQAILDMKLSKLTSLEQNKLKEEYENLLKLIADLKDILASELRVLNIIKDEVKELMEKYGDERRTEIVEVYDEIETEDLIPDEDVVITATYSGYVKKQPLDLYKMQKRGGVGIKATKTKEDDAVEHLFTASTHSMVLCFSNKGKVYWLKAYEIPTGSRYSKGTPIINILRMEPGEKINAMIPIKEFDDGHYLIMATKKGLLKKTNLKAYSKPRKGGIIAIGLRDNDELVNVRMTNGKMNFIIATKKGVAVKFNENDVRAMGRTASGVRGVNLRQNDEVIGLEIGDDNMDLLTITENGYGKRTSISDYRLIRRGGKGVINIKTTARNGNVVGIKTVSDEDEVMFISQNGVIIRTPVSGISKIGRNTQGVRIMKLKEGDKVTTLAKVVSYAE
ncbi:DNA gyrase subunit A [Candidatus Woesearchaeota archaeon]|nr:MAG: DNA gyrase subunit A [Candidatus Woesearchaeota archaeon]